MGCHVNFSSADNDFAYRLYQGLVASGASCEEVDGATGADSVVSSNDVFDFALATQNERYQRITQDVLGHHIPWVLNDFDPSTSYDEDIRAQVTERIGTLKDILGQSGLVEGTDEYAETLGIAVYLLFFMPESSRHVQIREAVFQIFTDGLHVDGESARFAKLKESLISNGGFGGLTAFSHDVDEEYTALEAFHYKLSKCTEHARILYAMMKMAGLSPHLVSVGIGSNAWLSNHLTVGVNLLGGLKLIDIELKNEDSYRIFGVLTPRKALVDFYLNSAAAANIHNDPRDADRYISLALKVDSDSADANFKKSLSLMRRREYVASERILEKLIAESPPNVAFYYSRGEVRRLRENYAGALEDINKAIELGKDDHGSHHERAHALMGLNRYDEALADLGRTAQMKEVSWCDFRLRGMIMLHKGEYRRAFADFWKAIRMEPRKAVPAVWNETWSFVWGKIKNVLKGGGPEGSSGVPPSSSTSSAPPVSSPSGHGAATSESSVTGVFDAGETTSAHYLNPYGIDGVTQRLHVRYGFTQLVGAHAVVRRGIRTRAVIVAPMRSVILAIP